MKVSIARLATAIFFVGSGALVAGCGGGGGSAPGAVPNAIPFVSSTPGTATLTQQGPVTYLPTAGLSSSGTIVAGTHQAIVAVMSSALSGGTTFATDQLTVGAPGTTTASVRSLSSARAAAAPQHLTPVEAFPVTGDRALHRALQAFATPAFGASAQSIRTQSVVGSAPSVGSTANVWVQNGGLSSSSRPNVSVPATLLAQTAHGNIWIDNSLLSGANASPSFAAGSLTATVAQIGADFENAYASDTAHFASPDYPSNAPGFTPRFSNCGSDGSQQGTGAQYITEPADGRIDVMVVNSQNLGGMGGYFSSTNFITQGALNCLKAGYESNEAPFIFVGWFQRNGATYELQEDLVRGTAHELQHLISFVNHSILPAGAASASFDGTEATYINEGLSMLAQDLAVERMYASAGVSFDLDDAMARADVFLDNPQNYSLGNFAGIDPSNWGGNGGAQFNCGGGCYGGEYLWQRYLRDRFGGDTYTHAMESSGLTGSVNLMAATGESGGDLMDDFALAIAANSLGIVPSDPRFSLGGVQLSKSYTDQFGGSTTIPDPGTLTLTGASQTVTAPAGGFAFVSVPSVPSSGLPVTVTDQATVPGFALQGGLAQH